MEKLKNWAKENMVVIILVSIILIGIFLYIRRNRQIKNEAQSKIEKENEDKKLQEDSAKQREEERIKKEKDKEEKERQDKIRLQNLPKINSAPSPEALIQNEMDIMASKIYDCRTKNMTPDCRNLEMLFMSKGYKVKVSPRECPNLPITANCPPLITAIRN